MVFNEKVNFSQTLTVNNFCSMIDAGKVKTDLESSGLEKSKIYLVLSPDA